jgi:PIN domain nuclease of toxin-antitoxin system
MRFLLDTHILLWALSEPERLRPSTRAAIEDSDNDVLFSTASIWEIAIKSRLSRPDFALRAADIATEALSIGFAELQITWRAAAAVGDLPLYHRDPFDRILVAQAATAGIPLFTVDRRLAQYGDMVRFV